VGEERKWCLEKRRIKITRSRSKKKQAQSRDSQSRLSEHISSVASSNHLNAAKRHFHVSGAFQGLICNVLNKKV